MIVIDDVSKHFKVYRRRSSMLRDVFGAAREGKDFDVVKSLQGVSLKVPKGKVHGIIGMNGAGKSTLLKILTGVLDPSGGKVQIEGRVASLLELGTGFHGELTGRENVMLNASIMGMTKSDIEQRLPAIEAFAELGEFFDRPVKIYSSGMYVRLAFSFAVSVSPDVLIIDEALSVGDAYFQQKCLKRIGDFKNSGTTILFVSHDLGAVRLLCEEVTLLSKGKVIFNGSPMQALDLYNALLAEHKNTLLVAARTEAAREISGTKSFESGSREMEIVKVELLDARGQETTAVISGDPVRLEITAKVHAPRIENPTCGILIRDRLGYDIFGTNTHNLRADQGDFVQGQVVKFSFDINMSLGQGDYTVTVALHSGRSHVDQNYHWIERAVLFQVIPNLEFEFVGVARLPIVARTTVLSS